MKIVYAGAAALALFSIAIFGSGTPAQSAAAPIIVHVKDFKYDPTPLKLHVGDTVTFINDDEEPHTVTATDKSFDSAALDTNGSWKYTFKKAGTFAYFCELHPYMKATIVVEGK